MRITAKRTDWKVLEMSSPYKIDFSIRFTAEQFGKITCGLVPEEMEDKWFIFFENDWLFFHRSWTGHMTYKLRITRDEQEEDYSIKEFWVERDDSIYSNTDDAKAIQIVLLLIANGLLGQDNRDCMLHTS
jgi:hypothetical protein